MFSGDSLANLIGILAVFILVAANGFFVAAEFSLVSVRKSRVAELVAEQRLNARALQRAVEKLDANLAATRPTGAPNDARIEQALRVADGLASLASRAIEFLADFFGGASAPPPTNQQGQAAAPPPPSSEPPPFAGIVAPEPEAARGGKPRKSTSRKFCNA